MNIKVMDAGEAMTLLRQKPYIRSAYQEIYSAVDTLEKGKAIVIEFDDVKKATMCASALSAHVNKDNKLKRGRFCGCYYSKSGSIIVIGKN